MHWQKYIISVPISGIFFKKVEENILIITFSIYIYIYIKTIAKIGNQQQAETTDKVIEIIVVNIFPQNKINIWKYSAVF